MKAMIEDLRITRVDGNPYVDRSESEIAWMLLHEELKRQHKRLCPPRGA